MNSRKAEKTGSETKGTGQLQKTELGRGVSAPGRKSSLRAKSSRKCDERKQRWRLHTGVRQPWAEVIEETKAAARGAQINGLTPADCRAGSARNRRRADLDLGMTRKGH